MTREDLPTRRGAITVNFNHALDRGGQAFPFRVTFSAYTDGRLAELFLNSAGVLGTAIDVGARDAAIAASLALQFGCPAETLRHALTRDGDGAPSGVLGRALDEIAKVNAS